MGLIFRRTFRGPLGSRVNLSRSGVSVTKRWGPISVNSRGHVSVRLLPGLSWRIF